MTNPPVRLFAFTPEEIEAIESALHLLESDADLSSSEFSAVKTVQSKLEGLATHRHCEREHRVRLVAPYVKKKGCEVPLTLYETECGKLYVRTNADFAERMVPVT